MSRRKSPSQPALAVELRGIDLFEDALLSIYNRSNSVAVSSHPMGSAGVGGLALRQAEALLGQSLPVAVRAFYQRLDGGLWLHPAKVLRLEQMVRTGQVIATTVFDLRQMPAPYEPKDVSEVSDPRVQGLIWHRDWWPIAEFGGGYLCVDMSPGPEGCVGQIIRVADPRNAHVAAAPQWVAASWLEVLAQLHLVWQGQSAEVLEALGPSRGHQLPPTWFMAIEAGDIAACVAGWKDQFAAVALPPAPTAAEFDAQAWRTSELSRSKAPIDADPERWLRHRPLYLFDRPQNLTSDSVDWLTDSPPNSQAATRLLDWLHGNAPPRALLLEQRQSSKAETLPAFSHWAAQHTDSRLPTLVLIDLAEHARSEDVDQHRLPTSLVEIFDAEAKARDLPQSGTSLWQAIQAGQCVLVLETAEAFLPHRPGLWHWLQALVESSPTPSRCRALVGMSAQAMRSGQALGLIWARLSERPLQAPPHGAWLAVISSSQGMEAAVQPAETAAVSDEMRRWHAVRSWTQWLERVRPPEWSEGVWREVAEATFDYFDALTACYWRLESDAIEEHLMQQCQPAIVHAWSEALRQRCLSWWLALEDLEIQGTQLLDGCFVQEWPIVRLFQRHCAGDTAGFSKQWGRWEALGAEGMIRQRWESLMSQLPAEARVPGAVPAP
jgi:cell wall assembly regulator SMI1